MSAYPNPRSLSLIQAAIQSGANIPEPQILVDLLVTTAACALGQPAVARQLAAGATTANTELTATTRRISMRAIGADIRFSIGSTAQAATSSSHFIADGERLDFAVPATPNIAIIRNASTSGTLELTELA
jgi:hypothetical protein